MNMKNAQYAYREAAIRSASQVGLVIVMYDMVIEDLRRAVEAIQANDIEKRTGEVRHALSVLEQLQGTLNLETGGEAASNMDRWYSVARAKLLEGHLKVSAEIFRSQQDLFVELRNAWQQAEQVKLAEEGRPAVAGPGTLQSVMSLPNQGVEIGAAADWIA